jgi:hypothetical protein
MLTPIAAVAPLKSKLQFPTKYNTYIHTQRYVSPHHITQLHPQSVNSERIRANLDAASLVIQPEDFQALSTIEPQVGLCFLSPSES